MKNISNFLCLLLLSITISCSNSSDSSSTYNNKLTQILESTNKSATVPGSALLVKFKDDSVWKKAAGYASIGKDSADSVPMNTEMQFRVGSITKTMIATAVLILIDKGALKLDDSVEKILPDLISYGDAITIEALLSHTSRLINYTSLEKFETIYLGSPTYEWTKDEIIDLFKNEELIPVTTGESFYSNSNYYLLGMVIEKISNMSLESFLDSNIFRPLKMNNTYLPVNSFLTGNFSDGYLDLNLDSNFSSDEKITNQNTIATWSAGSIISNLSDLSIWMNELINGNLISKSLQNKRMEFNWHVYGSPDQVSYGLGVMNQFGQIGHTGAVAGYSTIMFNYKGNDIIAFTNGYYLKESDPNITIELLEAVVEMLDEE